MPRRHLVAPLLLAAVLGLPACSGPLAAGEPVTQLREAADVTAVVLATSGDLVITLGDVPRLEVTAGEHVIDGLTSRADDGTLHLGTSAGTDVRGDVRYRLTTPSLESVTVRGSGTVRADFTGSARPTIAVDGSGAVDARHLDAEEVTTELAGSGRVALSGASVSQVVAVEGSGDYAAFDLTTEDATVTVRGSGSVRASVTGSLDATVDGSGSVTHRGGPRVQQDVEGSGAIQAVS